MAPAGVPVASKQARYSRRKQSEDAEIGEIPPVVNPRRRAACADDLLLFLQTYFPDSTGLNAFSVDHVQLIDSLQHLIRNGGRDVNAVYRGFAKTTATENAAIWAGLFGYRTFLGIFAAESSLAHESISSIRKELTENDLLAEDFPEVCYPFQALDGKPQRCIYQTHQGWSTHIQMSADRLVFPTIYREGGEAAASGCIILAKGLESASRGLSHKRPDGRKVRPDFVFVDDPQTDASAKSPTEVESRLKIFKRAILKAAGHRKKIAAVVNGTPIEPNDFMEQLLDQERNPSFNGRRVPMVRKWADANDTLWEEYRKILQDFDRDVPGDMQRAWRAATEFYRLRQKEMDAGCVVSWHACFDPDLEISAIQHAYNMLFEDGPDVFASECQMQTAKVIGEGLEPLEPSALMKRVNGLARREVPVDASVLTGFIDVHDDVLYYGVGAFGANFSGWLVDYGTWPEQRGDYFTKRQAQATLRRKYKGLNREDAIKAGLRDLTDLLAGREYKRTDGGILRIGKLPVDSGWQPDEVEEVCRTSPHAAILQMSRGIGVEAKDIPIPERLKKQGQVKGDNWYTQPSANRALRVLWFDTNHWKSFFHGRATTPVGSSSAFSLFGSTPNDHRMLCEHLSSELPKLDVSGYRGRSCTVWKKQGGHENHLLDVVVGLHVAASMLGISIGEIVQKEPIPGQSPRSLAEMRAERRQISRRDREGW